VRQTATERERGGERDRLEEGAKSERQLNGEIYTLARFIIRYLYFVSTGGKLVSETGRFSNSMSVSAGCGKNRKLNREIAFLQHP